MRMRLLVIVPSKHQQDEHLRLDMVFNYEGGVEGAMAVTNVRADTVTDWNVGDVFEFQAPIKVIEDKEELDELA